jgi:hypothetical protein
MTSTNPVHIMSDVAMTHRVEFFEGKEPTNDWATRWVACTGCDWTTERDQVHVNPDDVPSRTSRWHQYHVYEVQAKTMGLAETLAEIPS